MIIFSIDWKPNVCAPLISPQARTNILGALWSLSIFCRRLSLVVLKLNVRNFNLSIPVIIILLLKDSPSVNEIGTGAPVQMVYPWIIYFDFIFKNNIELITCFRTFLENIKMSSSLPKILETGINVFINNSQIIQSKHIMKNQLYTNVGTTV